MDWAASPLGPVASWSPARCPTPSISRCFTFSYSPVRGAEGVIEGVMDIATETTRQVLAHRRLELLGEDDVAMLALCVVPAA